VTAAVTNTSYAAFGSKNNAVTANNRNTTPPIKVTEKEIEKSHLTLNKDEKMRFEHKNWGLRDRN
jgi:hypothetical protein